MVKQKQKANGIDLKYTEMVLLNRKLCYGPGKLYDDHCHVH
jgi:hypothetical protein